MGSSSRRSLCPLSVTFVFSSASWSGTSITVSSFRSSQPRSKVQSSRGYCQLSTFVAHHRVLIISFLSSIDILCVCAVVPFGILYPSSKGYVYLEGFWTMLASILFSFLATILISIDLHRTPNFRLQGSGVTHKQRILIAEAMSLCFYLAIGALIFIYLEKWSFLDAL